MRVPVFSVLISSLISNIIITLKFNVVGLMILHYNNTTCRALVGLTQKDNSKAVVISEGIDSFRNCEQQSLNVSSSCLTSLWYAIFFITINVPPLQKQCSLPIASPRPLEISEKNWSTNSKPLLTSHLWSKPCWKYEQNPGSPLGSTS